MSKVTKVVLIVGGAMVALGIVFSVLGFMVFRNAGFKNGSSKKTRSPTSRSTRYLTKSSSSRPKTVRSRSNTTITMRSYMRSMLKAIH